MPPVSFCPKYYTTSAPPPPSHATAQPVAARPPAHLPNLLTQHLPHPAPRALLATAQLPTYFPLGPLLPCPPPFRPVPAGTPEEIRAEMERLRNRQYLARGVRRAMGVIPTTVPYIASLLTQLHQQRERAIEHELQRLQVLLDAAEKLEL